MFKTIQYRYNNVTEEEVVVRHLRQQLPQTSCPFPQTSCNFNSIFRTIDGSCNNMRNPTWGMAGTAQIRFLPSAYEDGIDEPRGGRGTQRAIRLPNSRYLSRTLHTDQNIQFFDYTNMVPQFGQFLDHDMSITPETSKSNAISDT